MYWVIHTSVASIAPLRFLFLAAEPQLALLYNRRFYLLEVGL